jgi:hypothetical protein
MMQEQNDSKHDLNNISIDSIYPDDKQRPLQGDSIKLLEQYSDNNCCDRICLWWFFHSSLGINKHNENSDDKIKVCICCNLCTWCCEFKCYKCKCCVKELACCCFTCTFQ